MSLKTNLIILSIGILLIIIVCNLLGPKIAYVDTQKLMLGFSEATKVEKVLKNENDKWQKELQILKDSLDVHVKMMSKEYDNATSARKKELQDILSASNQQINNFKQANIKKMEKLQADNLGSIVKKINIYIQEYGKKNRYSIILGTTQGGNILFADSRRYDITEKIINGLNERYK